MLVVDRSSPESTPLPTTIGEDEHGWVAFVQKSGIGAAAVQIWRRVRRFEHTSAVDERIKKRVDVDSPTVCVLGPVVGSRDAPTVETRSVVVPHRQFVISTRIVIDRSDFFDGVSQFVELFEDRYDL